jgi:hypothetical protein
MSSVAAQHFGAELSLKLLDAAGDGGLGNV